ncbi:hypothetical protein GCM10009789_82540 [Kribbella sancticallisti]|uniref:Uncharacterized protein n=1 Tax=Kribbella sancticallisti TaxID=460087 RepID=A0ABP4QT67_9ACTN
MYEALRWLDVPEAFRQPLVESMPDPDRTPELWLALQETCSVLRGDIGSLTSSQRWPDPPLSQRYFYFHAFLTVLPDIRRWHAEQGVSDQISQATLADLGTKVTQLGKQNWLARHFHGSLYRLGRLQFDRTPDGVLEVHIPGDGPLPPSACDESFAQAAAFFGGEYSRAVCHSWLLDEQLRDYLRPDSNIIRFQQRFTVIGDPVVADDDVIEFVFGEGATELPRETTLQRAIADHLAEGRHWHQRTGRLVIRS